MRVFDPGQPYPLNESIVARDRHDGSLIHAAAAHSGALERRTIRLSRLFADSAVFETRGGFTR